MLTVAFCHDSAKARTDRQRWFEPHIQHLRRAMSRIQLAAPLATADGATISNGDILEASVFALESPDFSSARELMYADPYFQQGVWESIDFYDVSDRYGSWATAPAPAPSAPARSVPASLALAPPSPTRLAPTRPAAAPSAQRLYAIFCAPTPAPAAGVAASSTDNFTAHQRYYAGRAAPAMFGAKLHPSASDTNLAKAARWNSVSFLCADSLHQAEAVAATDPTVAAGSWQTRVWAIPLAVGSWTGITEL